MVQYKKNKEHSMKSKILCFVRVCVLPRVRATAGMTIDTEGCSSLTALYMASEATQKKGRGHLNAYSLAMGGQHVHDVQIT